jgi:hypothetical protein
MAGNKEIGVNVDLSGNEAKNTRIENLAVIPAANPATIGRLMYDTVSKRVFIDTGTQVYSLSAQFGTLLANKVLVTDVNGFVSTDANFSWDTVNGQLVVKGGGTNPTDINITLTNSLAPVGNTIYVMGNGAMGFGVTPGLTDKINVNGKLRLSQSSGVGAALQIDVLNAIIGGTSIPVAKLDLMGGDASRPTLFLQPQTPYIGTLTEGMAWNDSVRKSLIEQQLIGNKVLSGFLGGSNGVSNTVGNTGVPTNITGTGYTYTIPANSLVVGKRLRVTFRGRYSTGAGSSEVNLRLQAGSNTVRLANMQFENNQTSRGFRGQADMVWTSLGISSTLNASLYIECESSTRVVKNAINPNISNFNYNTTIAQSINFNWAWVNPSASVSVTFEDVYFEILN